MALFPKLFIGEEVLKLDVPDISGMGWHIRDLVSFG